MLSFDTLNTIEAMLMSRSHPAWGELQVLVNVVNEVKREKDLVVAATVRPQPAVPPGPKEPPTPPGHVEVG